MKNGFSVGQIVALLTFGLVAYAGIEYHDEILLFLHNRFPREGRVEEAIKPAGPPNSLPQQIALCRKEKSGYQSCMFDAGYEVNQAWSDAHKAAKAGTSAEAPKDAFRAEPSPLYGVPYWVPRQPKK